MAKINKTNDSSSGADARKGKHLFLAEGHANLCKYMKSFKAFSFVPHYISTANLRWNSLCPGSTATHGITHGMLNLPLISEFKDQECVP